MRRPLVAALVVVAILFLFAWVSILISDHTTPGSDVKWRTHYETVDRTVPGPERTVEKTVPGPERTVFKKKPGGTTWIIVCGEKTQKVQGNKPFTECNLPDTGGGLRWTN